MPRGVSKKNKSRFKNVNGPLQNKKILIELCYEEFLQRQLLSTTFSSYMWGVIADRLNWALDGKFDYAKQQCKTKYYNGSTIEHGLPHYEYYIEMFSNNVAMVSMLCFSAQTLIESDEEDTQPIGLTLGFSRSRGSTRKRSEDDIHTAHTFINKETTLVVAVQKWGDLLEAKTTQWAVQKKQSIKECYTHLHAMEGLLQPVMYKAIRELKSATMYNWFLTLDDNDKKGWVESLGQV
ncbi:hypothetical protein Pfo_016315 [Paulownia fortunei]|nr:hypothetical protein Pfo_016315 [Paulownia fortunei]